MARSESLKKAQKKYDQTHKFTRYKANKKSAGKNFILNYANKRDLEEYMQLIKKRMKELEG